MTSKRVRKIINLERTDLGQQNSFEYYEYVEDKESDEDLVAEEKNK
jgi:hypothetical protein